jgi:hypothetical protein
MISLLSSPLHFHPLSVFLSNRVGIFVFSPNFSFSDAAMASSSGYSGSGSSFATRPSQQDSDAFDVFNTHPASSIMVFVAPNDPDKQLRGATSQARRSTPAVVDERDSNSRQLVFRPNIPFPQFLVLAGKTIGLSTAPRRGFLPVIDNILFSFLQFSIPPPTTF